MPKSREDYTRANRLAWNEVAPRHAAHNNAALFEAFKTPGHVTFDGVILDTLLQVGVEGKSVIQLCCNNGSETLSLRNMGTARCVGVDAADEFLAHGQEMIRIAGAEDDVELILCDVYSLPHDLKASFDVVLTTIGVLGWMPDLEAFFRVIQSLLKPGGKLVMEEMHPVLLMYEPDSSGEASSIQYSYFSKQTWEETTGLDYYGGEEYDSAPNYSFMHRLDEILMAGIANGLGLRSFKELDYDISFFCEDLEHSPTKPPLGFVMVMENAKA
ncbi:MAG: class I SAM-dependent methyltransferase [Gammaproteobacteria bacterium]|nr:class I SAM-dependent methyltransferase [Gammaproteobacteria bacterium]